MVSRSVTATSAKGQACRTTSAAVASDRSSGSKPWRAMAALTLVQLATYAWFTYADNNYPARVLVFNSTLALLSLASAVLERNWLVRNSL